MVESAGNCQGMSADSTSESLIEIWGLDRLASRWATEPRALGQIIGQQRGYQGHLALSRPIW